MCGILGAVRNVKDFPWTKQELHYLYAIITESLILSLPRGKDATGLARIDINGNWDIIKGPWPSNEFVKKDEYNEFMRGINSKTGIIIGHVRAKTVGSEYDNANNHPIVTNQVVGVHNGCIYNDDDLFRDLDIDRIGKVDSEIIFQLMDLALDEGKITKKTFEAMDKQLEGSAACAAFSLLDGTRLALFRNAARPVDLIWLPDLKTMFFVSEDNFVDKSIDNLTRFLKYKNIEFEETKTWTLGQDGWLIIDVTKMKGKGEAELKPDLTKAQIFTEVGSIHVKEKEVKKNTYSSYNDNKSTPLPSQQAKQPVGFQSPKEDDNVVVGTEITTQGVPHSSANTKRVELESPEEDVSSYSRDLELLAEAFLDECARRGLLEFMEANEGKTTTTGPLMEAFKRGMSFGLEQGYFVGKRIMMQQALAYNIAFDLSNEQDTLKIIDVVDSESSKGRCLAEDELNAGVVCPFKEDGKCPEDCNNYMWTDEECVKDSGQASSEEVIDVEQVD